MADLTNILLTDPTLQAIDQATEQANASKIKPPPYLAASTIGNLCERKIWLSWRVAITEAFTAEQIYRFEDGYRCEDVLASRLARVDGVKLRTIDSATGYQYSMIAVDGHLRGRVDGRITGLLQAPATEHVWEAKATDEKKLTALSKAKAEHGEKQALKAWDETYYAQAQLYMNQLSITRHYLTCTSAGARNTVAVRTDYNNDYAQGLLDKATRIKDSPDMPHGISDNPAWWQCKSCSCHALCHEKKVAQVHCRTCLHSTPVANGEWHCAKWKQNIPANYQLVGCESHLFIPSLITFAKPIDANPEQNWVEYQKADGTIFKNGQEKPAYSSREIYQAQDYNAIGNNDVDALRAAFNAEVVA